MRIAGVLAGYLLLLPSVFGQELPQPGGRGPEVQILEPTGTALLVGKVTLKAALAPEGTAVEGVEFFVDGEPRPVCRLDRQPYECVHDFGERLLSRTIRVVVSFPDGTRTAATVVTARGLIERVETNAVLVPVVVTDYLGRFVKGLLRESFTVFEDDRPQSITFFQSEKVPLELVIAVDISASMTRSMPSLKAAVKRFLNDIDALRRDHPYVKATVLAFNDRMFVVAKPAASLAEQLSAVDRLNAFGGTALYDAVLTSVDLIGDELSRKAIVVFTDGDDRSSRSSVEPVQSRIRQTAGTVYAITFSVGSSSAETEQTVRQLATMSGGRAFSLDRIDRLDDVFAAIVEDLTNQYLMGYTPTSQVRDGAFRKISVKTTVGSHAVRAREGYRARAR